MLYLSILFFMLSVGCIFIAFFKPNKIFLVIIPLFMFLSFIILYSELYVIETSQYTLYKEYKTDNFFGTDKTIMSPVDILIFKKDVNSHIWVLAGQEQEVIIRESK